MKIPTPSLFRNTKTKIKNESTYINKMVNEEVQKIMKRVFRIQSAIKTIIMVAAIVVIVLEIILLNLLIVPFIFSGAFLLLWLVDLFIYLKFKVFRFPTIFEKKNRIEKGTTAKGWLFLLLFIYVSACVVLFVLA